MFRSFSRIIFDIRSDTEFSVRNSTLAIITTTITTTTDINITIINQVRDMLPGSSSSSVTVSAVLTLPTCEAYLAS
jgi:hypothetical protein